MKKISFKKIGLLIRNNYVINRSIPIILFIVTLVLGCLIGAMPVSDVETRYEYSIVMNFDTYENYQSNMNYIYEDLIGFDSIFSIVYFVAAFGLAFLLVVALNGFMRDKSGNDFYHSLSVTRGELFIANYLTALINVAVTIVVSQLGGLLLMDFLAGYKPMTLGEMILEQLPVIGSILLFAALFTALAMIATVAAGSVFAGIINYAFLNFYIPATILAVSLSGLQLFNTDLMEYLEHYPTAYAFTSPFIRYLYSASGYREMTALSYILIALSTLALIALGIVIYTRKKNENASKPLPFTRTVRPLQYLITFDAILLGATFFEAITSSFTWCLIGALLALFFSFIVFNAFANKSFNGVFKNSRHMVFILIATLIVGAVFVADVFNIYKEPVPNYDEIKSCYLNVSTQYEDREEWVNYDFEEEINEYNKEYSIELTEDIAEELSKLYELVSSDESRHYDDSKKYLSISMSIRCKNDHSSYHTYAYVSDLSENWAEISAIVDSLKEKYKPSGEQVYYYEKTESSEPVVE